MGGVVFTHSFWPNRSKSRHTDLGFFAVEVYGSQRNCLFLFAVDLYPRVRISWKIAAFCGPLVSTSNNLQHPNICLEFATFNVTSWGSPSFRWHPKMKWWFHVNFIKIPFFKETRPKGLALKYMEAQNHQPCTVPPISLGQSFCCVVSTSEGTRNVWLSCFPNSIQTTVGCF